MSKIVVSSDATGVTKTDTTMIDNALLGVTSLTKIASDETQNNVYYSEKSIGQTFLVGAAAGFFLGDRFGHKVPFLGGRRDN